ncbi:hypothetical protein QYE76_066509 [Lolium multiflorum]|uniref:CCHC-type domain-containing protein n=1 Tax=Lolium multiflorum TaxID=4521 RepID=A0AAD8SAZ9_LOLMU|nr:hypothetical protein QYE76_066509 [Lolium multiflorum]
MRPATFPTSSSKPVSNVSNTKKSEPAASGSGSSMSTARNRDMNCHTCGDKGHLKRDCPNRKVMLINDNDEYETGDDVDPDAPEDDDYDSDGVDAYPSEARTIVVSQRALNVQPSASTRRCNLLQTKALVDPDKACKVIIDGRSCRNLASKELRAKLKLKYLPHPHPCYIQWLSDNGEMKVNHMVRVDFEIGPYKDSIYFDVVPIDKPFMKDLIRLGTQFVGYRDYAAKLAETLVESNKRADALAIELEQNEKARKKAQADAATVDDLRKRLHEAETSLSDNIAHQSAREKEILTRLESQSRRFVRKTQQDYELESPEGDQLLDALSRLEIHGDEAREGLAEARTGLSRLFPYFFKKKEAPASFTALAKYFNSQEDLGLQLRQEGLKVGVEGTIALVADSQQEVDWARVGNTEEMETKRWQSLIKAAKPNSKKILAYLGYKPTPAPSSSKPEVK